MRALERSFHQSFTILVSYYIGEINHRPVAVAWQNRTHHYWQCPSSGWEEDHGYVTFSLKQWTSSQCETHQLTSVTALKAKLEHVYTDACVLSEVSTTTVQSLRMLIMDSFIIDIKYLFNHLSTNVLVYLCNVQSSSRDLTFSWPF